MTANKEFYMGNGRTLNDICSRVDKTTLCSCRRRVRSLWDLWQEVNESVISWSEAIVDKLGRMRGPAVFVVNDSTEVYVRQKTRRSFWSFGAVDKSVINRRSVTEEVRERVAYGDVSSEETTSQHLSWDLNARTIFQHYLLAASSFRCRNYLV